MGGTHTQDRRRSVLTVFEHDSIPVGDGSGISISDVDAETLLSLNRNHPGFCERGHRSIRLRQYCGIVPLRDCTLEILPKVQKSTQSEAADARAMLLRLLLQAGACPPVDISQAGQDVHRAVLLDVFVAAFFSAVRFVVQGGLLQQYQAADDDLPTVRGRILVERQFSTLGNRGDVIACRFDELTADNVWNGLVQAGISAVGPWIRDDRLYRQYLELRAVFDGIRAVVPSQDRLRALKYDRQAMRYRTVIDWVKLILAIQSPSLRAGPSSAPALLFDMNVVFEEAIAGVLRARAARRGQLQIEAQVVGRGLAEVVGEKGTRQYRLKPDLVVRSGDTLVAIADTKWKRLKQSSAGYLLPSTGDMYQMQAYAVGWKCEKLVLIYPWSPELEGSRETAYAIDAGSHTATITVACVDLASDAFTAVRGAPSLRALDIANSTDQSIQ